MSARAQPSEQTLRIRKNFLDEEASQQPQLMFLWGTELALAREKVQSCKNRLKLRGAEVTLQARSRPQAFGFEKMTDSVAESLVLTDVAYQEIQEELLQAEKDEGVLDAFVKALVDRKSEIQNLTQLHGQQFWSKVTVNKEAMTEADESLNKSMPKKRRQTP